MKNDIYNPWHYIEVLKRKPGALRNGAPFKAWELPKPLVETREALTKRSDGDSQFVDILGAVPLYGLDAVVTACSEAMASGPANRDVVLNILSRSHDDKEIVDYEAPSHLPVIKVSPIANCSRYNDLLSGVANA